MTYRILLVALLGSFWWSSLALAGNLYNSNGIRIDQAGPGEQCLSVTQVQTGVYDIEINNIAAFSTTIIYTISATSSNVKIRNIWVEPCEVPSWPSAIVQVIVNEDGGTFEYVQNIRKRSCVSSFGCDDLDGNTGTLNVSINSITGHIGHPSLGGIIECDNVDWLYSEEGNIYADVLAQSSIERVFLPGGSSSVFGDLVAVTGEVFRVQAAGSVGTAMAPVTISGVGDTDIISAANGGVHAHINIDGNVRNIRSLESDWTGSFSALVVDDDGNPSDVGAGYNITGNPTGTPGRLMTSLTIEEDWQTYLRAEQIAEDVLVRIGNDLNDSAYFPAQKAFQLRALNGLAGQIIVNAEMIGGDWNGSVRVNTSQNAGQPLIDLSPTSAAADEIAPHYKVLSHRLGGGAVGLAPFNFHQFAGPAPIDRCDLDCNPFHTEYLSVGDCEEIIELKRVDIEHYGPVFVRDAADQYRVEFRPAFTGGGPTWFDVSSQFVVDTTFTATTEANAHRVVRLVAATGSQTNFAAAGWFRFRPLIINKDDIDEHQVRCAWVNGNPGVAYDSSIVSGDLGNTSSGPQYDWYQFRVGLVPCPPESMLFEGDQVNPSDIAVWLDEPFEVNMDGQICEQDLADMLTAYDAQ